jgi:hypothetical protein
VACLKTWNNLKVWKYCSRKKMDERIHSCFFFG